MKAIAPGPFRNVQRFISTVDHRRCEFVIRVNFGYTDGGGYVQRHRSDIHRIAYR